MIQENYLVALLVFAVITTSGLILILTKFLRNNKFYEKQLASKAITLSTNNELLESIRLEMQEETMNSVSQELHDNVGHSLTLMKMELENLAQRVPSEFKEDIHEIEMMTSHLRDDIRSIFTSLKSVQESVFFSQDLKNELKRIEKVGRLKTEFEVIGIEKTFKLKEKIVLIRICQEIIQNVLKHAKATRLNVVLIFSKKNLIVKLNDDGIGFQLKSALGKGMGMQNLKERANMINAEIFFNSVQGEGTEVQIKKHY